VETLRPYHPASTVPLFYDHLLTYCFSIEYTLTHPSFTPTCHILSKSVRISNILTLTVIKSMVSVPTQSVRHEHTLANRISSIQTQFLLYITHSEHTLSTIITVPPTYDYTCIFFIYDFQNLHYNFLNPTFLLRDIFVIETHCAPARFLLHNCIPTYLSGA
jgi:hypothetical protein